MIRARLLSLAATIVIAAGCSRVSDTAPARGAQRNPWTIPGVLRMSAASDPKNLNPMLDGAQPTGELSMFLFSYAVRYDAPTSVFFENSADGVLQGGKYDVAEFAWASAADPDDSPMYSARNFAPHGENALFWNDPVATRAMDDALKTVKWPLRVREYHVVQQRIASQVPTIILWFRQEPEVYNSDLRGLTPVLTTPFWNTWEYSI